MVGLDVWKNNRSGSQSLLDFFSNDFDSFLSDFPRRTGQTAVSAPACDIEENEGEYLLSLDVPGMKKSDIQIEVENGQIIVSGQRTRNDETRETNYLRVERSYGSFRRVFQIPQGVQGDSINASYEDGVLYLTIPKSEMAKRHKVEIGSGKLGLLKNLTGKEEKTSKE